MTQLSRKSNAKFSGEWNRRALASRLHESAATFVWRMIGWDNQPTNIKKSSICKFCTKFAILLKIKHLFGKTSIRNLGKQSDEKYRLKLDGSVPKFSTLFVILFVLPKFPFFSATHFYSISYRIVSVISVFYSKILFVLF